MRGVKAREFRSVPTKIRGRVYVYAGKAPGPVHAYLEFGLMRADLPTGLLVGTVDVVDCEQVYPDDDEDRRGARFAYILADPRRLARSVEPEKRPQPIWFRPFGSPKNEKE
jgi:hypothetical protein